MFNTIKFFMFFPLLSFASSLQDFILPEHFQVNFEQLRYIKTTDMKLKASGIVEVEKSKHLIWKQVKPFENTIVITPNTIKSNDENIEGPVAHYMGKILFDIFKRDISSLEKLFTVEKGQGQSLILHPKDDQLSKMIKKIEIKGEKHVDYFSLSEQSGNVLTIHFKNFKEIKE